MNMLKNYLCQDQKFPLCRDTVLREFFMPYLEIKYDGVRACRTPDGQLWTREGKTLTNPHLVEWVTETLKQHDLLNLKHVPSYDLELMPAGPENFSVSSGICKASVKHKYPTESAKLVVLGYWGPNLDIKSDLSPQLVPASQLPISMSWEHSHQPPCEGYVWRQLITSTAGRLSGWKRLKYYSDIFGTIVDTRRHKNGRVTAVLVEFDYDGDHSPEAQWIGSGLTHERGKMSTLVGEKVVVRHMAYRGGYTGLRQPRILYFAVDEKRI